MRFVVLVEAEQALVCRRERHVFDLAIALQVIHGFGQGAPGNAVKYCTSSEANNSTKLTSVYPL